MINENYYMAFDIPTANNSLAKFNLLKAYERFDKGGIGIQNGEFGKITIAFVYEGKDFKDFAELKTKVKEDTDNLILNSFEYKDENFKKYIKGQLTTFLSHIKKFDNYTFIEDRMDKENVYPGIKMIWNIRVA